MNRTKRIITIILCLVMAVGNFSMAFADTSEAKDFEGHWAQTTIQKWIDESKISGYPDGSFKPDANITRAEFVKLVNGLIDFDTKGNIAFNDVKTGDWYYDVISIANEIGYISGYSDEQFGPNDNITREQAAAILSRIQYLGENASAADKFVDSSKISSWALGAVGAASEVGFINGYDDGGFKPLNNLTRAEAVTMLDNVLVNSKNEVITKAGTELNDTVVEGDLIIAKTVGEGDVHLNNVEVKGSLYVYGGGNNSIYFNNVKVAKIIVEKNKVRLVLDDGTTVGEILVNSETILDNIGGTVAKVTINTEGKVTLSGNFDEVIVESSGDIVLNDAKIENLVVEKAINILGTGTIATLTANADGIKYDSTTKITKTVIGDGVTEKPTTISSGGTGGPSGPSGGDTTTTYYDITFTSKSPDGLINKTFPINSITSTKLISDILLENVKSNVEQTRELLDNEEEINDYLDKVNSKLQELKINGKLVTSIGLSELADKLSDPAIKLVAKAAINKVDLTDGVQKSELEAILTDYEKYIDLVSAEKAKLENELQNIASKIANKDIAINYNGKEVTYSINYNETTQNIEQIATLLNTYDFSTMTVEGFYNIFGDSIVVNVNNNGKTATTTLTITKK